MVKSHHNHNTPGTEASLAAGVLHEAVLETLASAVVSLEPGGMVTTFNAAAGMITGIEPEAVIGRTFAEVFLSLEGAEEFTQAVLDAIYEGTLVHQRVVNVEFPSGKRALAVSASRVRGGRGEDAGVAVVFDDISELRELRDKELQLAQALETQHRELQQAYLKLEAQNDELQVVERQARRSRIGGVVALGFVLLVVGISVVNLQPDAPAVAASVTPQENDGEGRLFVVEPRAVSRVVNITGQLAPRREVDIISPMQARVAAVHVPYGVRVVKDQLLVELDVNQLNIEHRQAEAAHIKAIERFSQIENWEDSVDVARARRSLNRAKIDLEDARNKLEETNFLLERGVIPSSEQEAATRNLENRRFDLEAAEQSFKITIDKGASDRRVAQLELDNARARFEDLSETLKLSMLRAPVAGVVMRPPSTGGEQLTRLAAGDSVSKGQRLLIIGDLDGLSVVGQVDEVDIVSIQVGNEALIKGDAFEGLDLAATVTKVSSQASSSLGYRALPRYDVEASVDRLSADQLALLRLGMSAVIEIVVSEKDDALMVPIEAVFVLDNQPSVLVNKDGEVTRRPVELGEVTVNAIEVVTGVFAGDELVIPNS